MDSSPFTFTIQIGESKALYEVSGELDAFAYPDLAATVAALPGNIRTVNLDLARVTFIDASGIDTLVRTHRAIGERGGHLVLGGASDYVRQMCTLAGVATALGIDPRSWPDSTPTKPGRTSS